MHGKKKKSRDRRYVCVRLWVCVCVCERERESVCVCMCVLCVCVCTRSPYVVQSSRRVYICDVTHPYMCDVTHPYVWHDAHPPDVQNTFCICVWIIYKCDMTRIVTWLIPTWHVTHSYLGHDSIYTTQLIRVTWCSFVERAEPVLHIHTCDITHSYVWHDSFTSATANIHMCDMTRSCVWLIHESCITHSHV